MIYLFKNKRHKATPILRYQEGVEQIRLLLLQLIANFKENIL